MKFFLHPIILFLAGSFIGLSPYFFDSRYFDMYRTFVFDEQVLWVYMLGIVSFILGAGFLQLMPTKTKLEINNSNNTKDLNLFISLLLVLSFLVFVKIISMYGMLPILSILSGASDIAFVNATQKSTGGGLYGVFSLLVFSLIILFPYSVINKKKKYSGSKIFWIHLFLLFIYVTYSGKRQMIFIFITFVCTYLYIYYCRHADLKALKKISKVSVVVGGVGVAFFLLVGLIRTSLIDEKVSLLDPVIQYATLPYMNLTNIVMQQESNLYSYSFTAFYESIFAFLPSFFKTSFFENPQSLLSMPLIEITSPSTVYGILIWNFGYVGVASYLFFLGFITHYLYKKAFYGRSEIFIALYSLTVWPLLAVHTYNHFINFTFYLLPILLIILGDIL
ncbi:O-antigen polymerase, partial [Vibrio sp. 10N.286.55.E12]